MHCTLRFRRASVASACTVVVSFVAAACGDTAPSAPLPQASGGVTQQRTNDRVSLNLLDNDKFQRIRDAGQLCSFAAVPPGDTTPQVVVLAVRDFPFALPRVEARKNGSSAQGAILRDDLLAESSDGKSRGHVAVTCVVPKTMTADAFHAALVAGRDVKAWNRVFALIKRESRTTKARLRAGATSEALAARDDFVGGNSGSPSHIVEGDRALAGVDRTAAMLGAGTVARTGGAANNAGTTSVLAPVIITANYDFGGDLCYYPWCGTAEDFDPYFGSSGGIEPGGGGTPGDDPMTDPNNYPTPTEDSYMKWSKPAHEALIDHAFPNACPDVVRDFKSASLREDVVTGWLPSMGFRHFTRSAGEDPFAARKKSVDWVEQRLQRAERFAGAGMWQNAVNELGGAMHTMMDMTSPVHVDANGYPRVYPAGQLDELQHSPNDGTGNETSKDITPALFALNDTNLRAAYNRVMNAGSFPGCNRY